MNNALFGKYRGMVVNNVDPMQIGRIQVSVPAVGPLPLLSWAMPCFPMASIQAGIVAVPSPGAGVWVEFEGGQADHPIWTGCYYGTASEVPTLALTAPPPIPSISLQTAGQNGLVISDMPGPTGGIMIKSATGAMIIVNDIGITIQNGQGASIVLTGPSVSINNGALAVI